MGRNGLLLTTGRALAWPYTDDDTGWLTSQLKWQGQDWTQSSTRKTSHRRARGVLDVPDRERQNTPTTETTRRLRRSPHFVGRTGEWSTVPGIWRPQVREEPQEGRRSAKVATRLLSGADVLLTPKPKDSTTPVTKIKRRLPAWSDNR